MTNLLRCLAAAFAALLAAGTGWTQDSGPAPGTATAKPAAPKSIIWAKTWESALFEAKNRNVPIYILVSIGEG